MTFVRYFDIIHEKYVEELNNGTEPTNWKDHIIHVLYDGHDGTLVKKNRSWGNNVIPDGKYHTVNYVLENGICLFYRIDKSYKYGDDYENTVFAGELLTDQYFEESTWANNVSVLVTKTKYKTKGRRCFIQNNDHLYIVRGELMDSNTTAICVYDKLSNTMINEYYWNGNLVSYPEMLENKCLRSEELLREMTVAKFMKDNCIIVKEIAELIVDKFHILDCYLYVDPDEITNDGVAVDIHEYIRETDCIRRFNEKWLTCDGHFCADNTLRVLLSDDFNVYVYDEPVCL